MQSPTRFHIVYDSGAPEGSTDYTTVVILHGLGCHSGCFTKLVPLAQARNARVVLVNRRDYPGATPYTPAERARLIMATSEAMSDATAVCPKVMRILKEGAVDVSNLLIRFISDNRVPPAQPHAKSGGIVLVGWSLGAAWLTTLLASQAPSSADAAVDLTEYVRRIVFYDPPHLVLGFPSPEGGYLPFTDPSILPEELVEAFNVWVSGFVRHGETKDTLDLSKPPADLRSTYNTLTAEERRSLIDPVPEDPRGGSDLALLNAGALSGAFALFREEALRVHTAGDGLRRWDTVEVRHVWCDASPWPMPLAAICLQEEIAGKRKAGNSVRDIVFSRLEGANHLAHWEEPERVLKAFLE